MLKKHSTNNRTWKHDFMDNSELELYYIVCFNLVFTSVFKYCAKHEQ